MNVEELIAKARPLPNDGRVGVGTLVKIRKVAGRFDLDDEFLVIVSDKDTILVGDAAIIAGTKTDLARAIIGLREGEEKESDNRMFRIEKIYGQIE